MHHHTRYNQMYERIVKSTLSIDVTKSDFLTWLFERQYLPSKDSDELFIDAENPENAITRGMAKKYAQQIAYSLRKAENIGADGPGNDVIAMFSINQIMYPVAMLAVICAGGIWNPTPYNLNPTEAGRFFGITCPKLVFCSPELVESTREACDKADIPRSKIYVVSSDPHNIYNAETEESLIGHSLLPWTRITDIEILKSTPIILHFTSGTTGLPKAVEYCHYNVIANYEATYALSYSKNGDQSYSRERARVVAIANNVFSHGTYTHAICDACVTGGKMYVMAKFEIHKFGRCLVKYPITRFFTAPWALRLLVETDLPPEVFERIAVMHSILIGGAHLPRTLEDQFNEKINSANAKRKVSVDQIWGMTEAGWVFGWGMDDTDKIPASFGRLAAEIEATVVSDDGKELGPGEIGELIIRGSLLTKRYYRNPEATKCAIREGWFYTGDLVKYSKDRLFSFVDRKKELLKYDGNHISPAELEMILNSHPDIQEAAVVGIPDPGRPENDLPLAFVVRRSETLTKMDVKNHISSSVSDFKYLRGGVIFVGSIEKNPMGKLLRSQLREKAIQLTGHRGPN